MLLDPELDPDVRAALEAGVQMTPPAELEAAVWSALGSAAVTTAGAVALAEAAKSAGAAALGANATTTASVGTAALVSGASTKALLAFAFVGATAGGVGAWSVTQEQPPQLPAAAPAQSQAPARRSGARREPSAVRAGPVVEVAPVPADSSSPLDPTADRAPKVEPQRPNAAAPKSAPVEPDESALILAARQALRSGAPAVALERLASARRKFPRGALVQERDALEIEALARSGARDAAARRAAEFLKRYPKSPYAPTARELVR
jgi:hypothetical protein